MERWPPVYDADGLAGQIKALVEQQAIFSQFYFDQPPANDVPWCQGDIVAMPRGFPREVPFISMDGPSILEANALSGWLLLSNTCDMHRAIGDVPYAQVIPIYNLGNDEQIQASELQALKRYSQSRRFYIPSWLGAQSHHVADFTQPVTLARTALTTATLQARLSFSSWILLHSCLVRFLARDDGRFD